MRLAAALCALALAAAGAIMAAARGHQPVSADAAITIVVTSALDNAEGECPSDTQCTLREAIHSANANDSDAPLTIAFAPEVFPFGHGAAIALASPLPPLTRANVTAGGSAAGVRIEGAGMAGDGLVVAGENSAVRDIAVHGFSGACIVLAAPDTEASRNRVGNCAIGIAITGASASAAANVIGFADVEDAAAPVATGILVSAANVVIGDPDEDTAGNIIGFAETGVRVGNGAGEAFEGVDIARNTIGRGPHGAPAPVGTAIDLLPPSSGTLVSRNSISHARTGIASAPDADGVSVAGNSFVANTFEALLGLSIDLNGDGVTNPNHGEPAAGPNAMRNHPVITRAVQSRIAGTAAGCADCAVQLYFAEHSAGGSRDYGTTPVASGLATTDALGTFAFENPAVTPGQWVTAIVTDGEGNTSEFGPSARVGTGVAQCGNVSLVAGWNHAGYFGAEPLVLGAAFPDDGSGRSRVRAIYHYDEASGSFTHWIAGTTAPRTLFTLEPGEPYWFLANEAAVLGAGFSLSGPLPLQLRPGWNEIVYIGATADVRDALGSIAGKFEAVYRWPNTGAGSRWQKSGDGSEPAWARDFSAMETCATYDVLVSEDVLLTPLQP